MKKYIKNLVEKSYNNDKLDAKTVSFISDQLNRQTLKQYIRSLKNEEGKKQVIVTSPKSLSEIDKKKIQSQFRGKKIIYVLDPEMLGGIKIADKDTEFETSLNQTFSDIIRFLNQ